MNERKASTFCAAVSDAGEMLRPGIDLTLECEGYSVSFFWHNPSLNLTYYPICQIDFRDKTLLHWEGSENRAVWLDWTEDIGERLARLINA